MNKLKVGDTVRRVKDSAGDLPVGTITTVNRFITSTTIVVEGYKGFYDTSNFELAKSKYPNPQHVHADVVIEWAKGADIEVQSKQTGRWFSASKPVFDTYMMYRVVPTTAELAAIKTQAKIDKLQAKIDRLKLKLKEQAGDL